MIAKEKSINIRVSKKEHDNVKKYGSKFSEIWKIGYEIWIRKLPNLLHEQSEKYRKLYEQCVDNFEKCRDNAHTIESELDSLCELYINTGRSVEKPLQQDKNWIKARISKLDGVSERIFLERCQILKECKNNER